MRAATYFAICLCFGSAGILPAETITAAPASLAFVSNAGATPRPRQLRLAASAGPMSFTATTTTAAGGQWLYVSRSAGDTPYPLAVAIAGRVLKSLPPGDYQGAVVITAPGAANNPLSVPVTLTVPAKAERNVVYYAAGVFAKPQLSGNDLLQLEGEPFQIGFIANKGLQPDRQGARWARYRGIRMRGTVTSPFSPTNPFPISSYHSELYVSTANPAYDEFRMMFRKTLGRVRLVVKADVHMPKGTLNGFLIDAFTAPVTLTNNPSPNVTATYSDPRTHVSTKLAIASGTFTATVRGGK